MNTRKGVFYMVHEIKLDGIAGPQTPAKPTRREAAPAAPLAKDGVSISNQLSSLSSALVAENEVPSNQQRIMELKHQIQTNQYQVDIDTLATKIARNLLTS